MDIKAQVIQEYLSGEGSYRQLSAKKVMNNKFHFTFYNKMLLCKIAGMVFSFIMTFQFAFSQKVIHKIDEKDLIPEGITYYSARNSFLISSIFKNKIIEVSKTGISDFIKNGEDGFMGGVGLHIDEKREVLWACSGNVMGDKFRTGIFAYNLNTGKLIKKVLYPTGNIPTLFNDLAIDSSGQIYVTNTMDNSIWKWGLCMDKPEKLLIKEELKNANGIILSPDEKYIFVATSKGIARITMENFHYQLLQTSDSYYSNGLDGLGYYKGSIWGVHDEGIIKFTLSEAMDSITNIFVIEKNNKNFTSPTTLVIHENKLYVLPNSQLPNLDQKNLVIKNRRKLKKSVVIEYDLEEHDINN